MGKIIKQLHIRKKKHLGIWGSLGAEEEEDKNSHNNRGTGTEKESQNAENEEIETKSRRFFYVVCFQIEEEIYWEG